MTSKRTEAELRNFYEQWAPSVYTFCKLYLGDSQASETVVTETFLKYFRNDLLLQQDHVPTALMSLALEESNYAGENGGTDADSVFEWAVLELPPDQRAVFVLQGVLDLPLPSIAAITHLPFAAASQLWVRALLQLRMSTMRDDCSRCSKSMVPRRMPLAPVRDFSGSQKN